MSSRREVLVRILALLQRKTVLGVSLRSGNNEANWKTDLQSFKTLAEQSVAS